MESPTFSVIIDEVVSGRFQKSSFQYQDGIQPSSFGVIPVLSLTNHFQLLHNLSTCTNATALLQYLECQIERLDLCFTCYVHRGRCVSCVANLLPKTLADLRVKNLTTIGAFRSGLFVRKLTRSQSRLLRCWARGRHHACTPSVSCTGERAAMHCH